MQQIMVVFDCLPGSIQHVVPNGEIIECILTEYVVKPDGTVVMVLEIREPTVKED